MAKLFLRKRVNISKLITEKESKDLPFYATIVKEPERQKFDSQTTIPNDNVCILEQKLAGWSYFMFVFNMKKG